jgi:GTPase SAR1 family protein
MMETIKLIKEKQRNSDYQQIIENFEKLNKLLVQAKKIVKVEGVPRFYLECILRLELSVKKVSKKDQRGLSKNNSKAFNKLK